MKPAKQTKSAQLEAVRAILYAYTAGSEVSDPDHVEHMLQVFTRHPEWAIKRGSGVSRILVDRSGYGGTCFFLMRIDGSVTDISFTQCINGKSSKLADVRAACRSAIRPEITAYRIQSVIYGETVCPISGEVLTKENTHIDHYDQPFQAVFDGWLAKCEQEWKIDVEAIFQHLNATSTDMETRLYFTDTIFAQALASSFITYHNANTHLRAVSKLANLSTLKRA